MLIQTEGVLNLYLNIWETPKEKMKCLRQARDQIKERLEDPDNQYQRADEALLNLVLDKMDYWRGREKEENIKAESIADHKVTKGKRKTGRPSEFDWQDTRKWHNELKVKRGYQHGNGKPHLTNIRNEIRKRHQDKTGFKPSMQLIQLHYRERDIN